VWRLCPKLWRQKGLDVASQQHTVFNQGIFLPKTTRLSSSTHPTCPTWSLATFLFPN
jgi:hypothetical protein